MGRRFDGRGRGAGGVGKAGGGGRLTGGRWEDQAMGGGHALAPESVDGFELAGQELVSWG